MAVRWNQMLWSGPLISTSGYLTNVHGLLAARAYPTRIAGCSWTIWADPEKTTWTKAVERNIWNVEPEKQRFDLWTVHYHHPWATPCELAHLVDFPQSKDYTLRHGRLVAWCHEARSISAWSSFSKWRKRLSSKLTDGSQIIPSRSHIKTWARKELTRI